MPRLRVAIDGPAGAGKSTVSRRVADALGYTYVDSGAMYRAVGLLAWELGTDPDDEAAVTELARAMDFRFGESEDGRQTVWLNGRDATREIRQPHISDLASRVSTLSAVRRELVRRQQEMGRQGGVVMEGRDIQTVVMPDAEVKVYLDASAGERARRRHAELQSRGVAQDLAAVEREVRQRDERDSTRADSPLTAAADAVHVVTDGLSIDEVVARVVDLVKERGGP